MLTVVPRKLGFKSVTWNFLESGHGKGAAGGLGAAVKREADRFVSNGLDISDAAQLYEKLLLNDSSIKCMYVSELDV